MAMESRPGDTISSGYGIETRKRDWRCCYEVEIWEVIRKDVMESRPGQRSEVLHRIQTCRSALSESWEQYIGRKAAMKEVWERDKNCYFQVECKAGERGQNCGCKDEARECYQI